MSTVHTCPKCQQSVVVDVEVSAYCLPCGVKMKRLEQRQQRYRLNSQISQGMREAATRHFGVKPPRR